LQELWWGWYSNMAFLWRIHGDLRLQDAQESAPLVKPVFVSVHPARDSIEKCVDMLLVSWLTQTFVHFHPRLISLTGRSDAVKSMCNGYGVYLSQALRQKRA
jgi:cytochrome oxidase Cu insertion factor (SCO1/SenC/PrrC family)